MGRGRNLTPEEKGAIDGLLKENFLVPQIAKNINRSTTAVRNYMNKKTGAVPKKGGRPKKTLVSCCSCSSEFGTESKDDSEESY